MYVTPKQFSENHKYPNFLAQTSHNYCVEVKKSYRAYLVNTEARSSSSKMPENAN